MKKYLPVIIVIATFLVFVLFFWNNKYNYYTYNESIYTDETILNDFNIYENDFIKFLYPKDWIIKRDDEKNVAIYSDDVLSDNFGYINVGATIAKPNFFQYYFVSDKLTEIILDKADTNNIHTKIIKRKINGNRCVILYTLVDTEDTQNISSIEYYVERSDNYINFAISIFDGNNGMEKIILESVEYK